MSDIRINELLYIYGGELHWTFSRSSGKGGQNVNKVNSKATLHWNVLDSTSLPRDVKERFMERFSSRIKDDGDLVLQSDEFRDQGKNISRCVEKLVEMVRAVEYPPKVRVPTRPTRSSKAKRADKKQRHSEKKKSRRAPVDWD